MRKPRVNPNIELVCDNCSLSFLRTKYEISRRKAKRKADGTERDHVFCSRSCSVSWRNKDQARQGVVNRGSFASRPQFGQKHAQKYNPKYAWYLKRMKHDMRFNDCWKIDLVEMEKVLEAKWNGKCFYTGLPLFLRQPNGSCETPNPFFIASLDRIKNDKPYGPKNVQWVSCAINMARNKHSSEDFQKYLKQAFDGIGYGTK